MNRRKYVAASVVTVASLSGCLGIDTGSLVPSFGDDEENEGDAGEQNPTSTQNDSQPPNGSVEIESDGEVTVESYDPKDPVDVVRAFYVALFTPDVEAVNELFHPESPSTRFTDDQVEGLQTQTVELSELEANQDLGEDYVTVSYELYITDTERPDWSREGDYSIVLEKDDNGDWRVWNVEN